MGELVVDMYMTLDGVVQAPGEPDEDVEGGFTFGGWQVPYLDADSGRVITDHIGRIDALLLGRKTYEIFAAYWPQAPDDDPIANRLNSIAKYVASRTLDHLNWNNASLIEGDVVEGVAKLKQRHGSVHIIGSGELTKTLMSAGQVDAYNLWLYPVVLGRGKKLFAADAVPSAFRLTSSTTFASGTVLLVYRADGQPRLGDMAWDADRVSKQSTS